MYLAGESNCVIVYRKSRKEAKVPRINLIDWVRENSALLLRKKVSALLVDQTKESNAKHCCMIYLTGFSRANLLENHNTLLSFEMSALYSSFVSLPAYSSKIAFGVLVERFRDAGDLLVHHPHWCRCAWRWSRDWPASAPFDVFEVVQWSRKKRVLVPSNRWCFWTVSHFSTWFCLQMTTKKRGSFSANR